MNKFILLIAILVSFNTLAGDLFIHPKITPEKLLQEIIKPNEQLICGKTKELKTSADPECQLYLGWGHTYMGHDYIKDINGCGIGMGCNSGVAGVGDLKNKPNFWRFQRGSNGTWANYEYQGTQNGGLNPVLLDDKIDYGNNFSKIYNKNSYLGFMRMTQYHWLKLKEYADQFLINKVCSDVKINFACVADDMQNDELNNRLNAWKKKLKTEDYSEQLRSNIETMNRIEPLLGCFGEEVSPDALPTKCNDSLIVSADTKIANHCKSWVEEIDKLPQHNWQTPKFLEKTLDFKFKANGPLH
jgi:hypothetical protein